MVVPPLPESRRSEAPAVAAVLLLALLLLVARIAGPSDVYDNDQPAPMAHSVDVAVNGKWLMQQEPSGAYATKPPLYPWLAALAIKATGRFDEWVFKLPSLLAAAVTCGIVFVLARRYVGVVGACAACAMWLANAHVFKLMYTARTDMLLAMWMSIAVLAALKMREGWRGDGAAKTQALWMALFWVAIAGGLFTKGPAGLIPAAFLAGLIVADRRWWQGIQLAVGLAVCVSLIGAWFLAAMAAYPAWRETFERETSRMVGLGATLAELKPWRVPLYFVARWLPWSVAFLAAAVVGHLQRERLRGLAWTVGWVAVVMVAYMFQSSVRGDYVLPAYTSAVVLIVAVAALDAGRARRWFVGGIAASFVVGAMVVAYNTRWSRAARDDDGRATYEVVRVAREAAAAEGLPIGFYETGYTPVQALLGVNQPMNDSYLDFKTPGDAIIIAGAEAWGKLRTDRTAEELYRTPPLKESKNTLVVLRVRGPGPQSR